MAKKAKLDILEVNIEHAVEPIPPAKPGEEQRVTGEISLEPQRWTGLISRLKARPWILILVGTLFLVILLAGILIVYGKGGEKKGVMALPDIAMTSTPPMAKDHIVCMEGFVVDQRNDHGEIRIVSCSLALELIHDKMSNEIENNKDIRHRIYHFLKQKKTEELLSSEARSLLKEELKGHLNQWLGDNMVRRVYITTLEAD